MDSLNSFLDRCKEIIKEKEESKGVRLIDTKDINVNYAFSFSKYMFKYAIMSVKGFESTCYVITYKDFEGIIVKEVAMSADKYRNNTIGFHLKYLAA